MKPTSENKPTLKTVGYDALLEDVFGLNIRGLKSLVVSLTNPRAYYSASSDVDWDRKYTPSFRLWFTLVAIMFFFQFFWAGSSSATIQSTIAQFEASGILPPEVNPKSAALEWARWNFGLLPFSLVLSFFLLAAIYPFWGEKLNFVVRQRKVFLTIIPGTLVTLPITLSYGLAPGSYFWILMGLTWGITVVMDFLTAFRGAFPVGKPRLGRALALATATGLAATAGSILASIATTAVMTLKYG